MRCPLCSGPLHEDGSQLECEFGHRVEVDHVSTTTELKLAEALWMAIEALNNEADVLRAVGGEAGKPFADEAEAQAQLLRAFGGTHARKVSAFNRPGEQSERNSHLTN